MKVFNHENILIQNVLRRAQFFLTNFGIFFLFLPSPFLPSVYFSSVFLLLFPTFCLLFLLFFASFGIFFSSLSPFFITTASLTSHIFLFPFPLFPSLLSLLCSSFGPFSLKLCLISPPFLSFLPFLILSFSSYSLT